MIGRLQRWLVLVTVLVLATVAGSCRVEQRPDPRPTQAPPTVAPTAPARPSSAGITEHVSRVHPGQRFFLYVPKGYDGQARLRLLVVMHGAGRRAEEYAGEFTDFADRHRYMILAPLFPRGERYQHLGIGEDDVIRADLRLLDLVDEIGGRYNVETATFDLFGFSAGGQFAHRFMYVHPGRLRAVVIAAPGTVTLPSIRDRWPGGVADLGTLTNVRFDLAQVWRVRPMLIVGEDDVDDENLNESEEANRFGQTRLQRARALHAAWLEARIHHEYVEVPGLGHELDDRIASPAERFLARS